MLVRHLLLSALLTLLQTVFGYAEDVQMLATVQTGTPPTATALTGRIVARNEAGQLLLEEPNGRLHSLTIGPKDVVTQLQSPFEPLTADQTAAYLLNATGAGFQIYRTDNFVICSDASELYTKYCGRLLQKVVAEYKDFFADSDLPVMEVPDRLQVVIFRNPAIFQAFARQQHPDTDFSDVPGYYSVRDNQMLISAVSGDQQFRTNGQMLRELRKNTRQIETIVHEAVHQLAFNTGLQVRYADNPLWVSEGLAVYFEHATGRGADLWTEPGGVNRVHLPGFNAASVGERLRIPLRELVSTDAAFQSADSLAAAYAESWALAYFLIRTDRAAFDRYLANLPNRRPLQNVSADDRVAEVEAAVGVTLAEVEAKLLKYMSRVRVR